MSENLDPPFPGLPTPSVSSGLDLAPRVLHREWKKIKPYLPKSTSLPALQLVPRDRPRYICCTCGFANFYNIPLCVWCATDSDAAIRAFEKTIPRTRTTSAPPRVFWSPNEISLRTPRASENKGITGNRLGTSPFGGRSSCDTAHSCKNDHFTPPTSSFVSADHGVRQNRRPHSVMDPFLLKPTGSEPARSQAHRRSHSQPNALRLGHRSRPYYSVIRKDTPFYTNSDARVSVAPRTLRPASLPLLATANLRTILDEEVDEFGQSFFAFVTPATIPERAPRRTLSSRLSRHIASPVSTLQSRNRAAEMRGELAALVRESSAPGDWQDPEYGTVTARLRKFRRGLKGLVRRTKIHSLAV
ncbi:hypothetical protein B0H16DRAFT_86968 [Mycena metata]|uniref:Uncharacterized protein n=1 Tax=Mycena metata TaxID=1033252 RepID=A0AAD7JZN9_9AGAR|nr:hypothetical protein B0H16DRAFT_86968 [Mycena metata]